MQSCSTPWIKFIALLTFFSTYCYANYPIPHIHRCCSLFFPSTWPLVIVSLRHQNIGHVWVLVLIHNPIFCLFGETLLSFYFFDDSIRRKIEFGIL